MYRALIAVLSIPIRVVEVMGKEVLRITATTNYYVRIRGCGCEQMMKIYGGWVGCHGVLIRSPLAQRKLTN